MFFGKSFSKTNKNGKQLTKSSELVKKNFNIDRDSIPHEEQKKINECIRERPSEFDNLEKKLILII